MTEQEHTSVENEQATDSTTTTIIPQSVIQRKQKSDTLKEVDKSIIDFFEVDEMPETTFRQFERRVFELIDTLSNPPLPHSLHSGYTSLHHSNPPSVSSNYIPTPSNSPYSPYSLHAGSSSLHHSDQPSVLPQTYDLSPVSTASLAHISYTFSP
ncbi:hypothetical protein JTB14_019194 [Gonioctena quinquepunctata]|nr:hypothetical protein JTB14_019194 [Gonioctena quinquepunctata]